MLRRIVGILLILPVFIVLDSESTAQTDGSPKKNKVIVMGMIHSGHKTSKIYDLAKVRTLIQSVKPDAVFCEIPPDRIEEANRQYKETGEITESRVRVFPEYIDVLYPLTKEMDFQMYACAGWTKPMADARREKMKELSESHKQQYQEMEDAQKRLDEAIEAKGGTDNPAFIHTQQYDDLVKTGLLPYDKHFNELLGDGGWTNINKAHYGLIEKNLDQLKGQNKTILIMFGAWHKYWFMEQLRQRDDIELINLNQYLSSDPNSPEKSGSGSKTK